MDNVIGTPIKPLQSILIQHSWTQASSSTAPTACALNISEAATICACTTSCTKSGRISQVPYDPQYFVLTCSLAARP